MSFHPAMPYGTEQWHRSQRATLPEGPEFAFTPQQRQNFEEFASHYAPENRVSAVLHALYLVQEQQGYISNNAVRHVAQVIGCTTADVEDVVSYYVMFHRAPTGKFVLQVCTTLSCALAGSWIVGVHERLRFGSEYRGQLFRTLRLDRFDEPLDRVVRRREHARLLPGWRRRARHHRGQRCGQRQQTEHHRRLPPPPPPLRLFWPRELAARYREAHAAYRALYGSLRDRFRDLARME